MTTSTYEALHTPLLGDENIDEQESATSQEQQPEKKPASSLSVTEEKDDADNADDLDDSILRYECFIFPFLLFVQFGLAFLRNGNEMTAVLSWQNVSLAIILLTATIWLYRGACADSKLNRYSWFFVFLPEILVNIILILALFDKVTMAYATVLLGGLFLAILGFVATVHFMCCKGQQQEQDEEEEEINADDDYSKQFDLLIV